MTKNTFLFNGSAVPFVEGERILTALQRAGHHPTGGGCLCFGGDCPHCVATVDGVSYVRTCQVRAVAGQVVDEHGPTGYPPLPEPDGRAATKRTVRHATTVVIGQGSSGIEAAREAREAGHSVIAIDALADEEAVGIYAGPMVLVRTPDGMVQINAERVVVATGAAEIQPTVPGSGLSGIVTARAAEHLASAGVELGEVVIVGDHPDAVDGNLVRFEGTRAVEAVIVKTPEGVESRHACETAIVALGLTARDTLVRMGHDLPVTATGDAAGEAALPPPPGPDCTVCPCSGVTTSDLDSVWDRGFREMELIKRATLAGTGTCQGGSCLPHLKAFIADRSGVIPRAFTARPVTRQLTIGEIAAGSHLQAFQRTALDGEHRALGAEMDVSGGWWRPWSYGDKTAEYNAVRNGVSIMDVGTLGKMIVSGPDVVEFLERVYPNHVADLKPGHSRYVLLLNERGYIFDDGLICRDSPTRFTLTFTSSGSTHAEMWLRDWAGSWGLDVRILNQTVSRGAINVTGPRSKELLNLAGLTEPPGFMRHGEAVVAGVPCRVFRLSFTGEQSFELHHDADHSVALWRALLDLGESLGVEPHGLEVLVDLRLEKGHILVGQDTDFDTTARRVNMEWAVKLDKPEFIGRQSVLRTNQIPLDKQLVGLEMDGEAPHEGVAVWNDDVYVGFVTSAVTSPVLGKSVMLAWVDLIEGAMPDEVTVEGVVARRVPPPFYDPQGVRARA